MKNTCIFMCKWSKWKLENKTLNLSLSQYNVQSKECKKCGRIKLKSFSTY